MTDLGFVRENLIFKTWNFKLPIGYKYGPIQGELSNVLLFWKQWREALGTGSPSFPISSAKMTDIDSVVSSKFRILKVWNFLLWYPDKSSFQPHRLEQKWILQVGLIRIFPRWLFWGLFSIKNLYRLPHVIVSHFGYEKLTTETIVCALPGTSWEISFGPS